MNILDSPPVIGLPEGKGFILLNSLSEIDLNAINTINVTKLQEFAYENGASEEELHHLKNIKELEKSIKTIHIRVSTTIFNMIELIETSLEKSAFNQVMGDLDRINAILKDKLKET